MHWTPGAREYEGAEPKPSATGVIASTIANHQGICWLAGNGGKSRREDARIWFHETNFVGEYYRINERRDAITVKYVSYWYASV